MFFVVAASVQQLLNRQENIYFVDERSLRYVSNALTHKHKHPLATQVPLTVFAYKIVSLLNMDILVALHYMKY